MAGLPLFNPFPIPLKFQLVSEDIPIPTHNRARFTGINIYAGKNRRRVKNDSRGGEKRKIQYPGKCCFKRLPRCTREIQIEEFAFVLLVRWKRSRGFCTGSVIRCNGFTFRFHHSWWWRHGTGRMSSFTYSIFVEYEMRMAVPSLHDDPRCNISFRFIGVRVPNLIESLLRSRGSIRDVRLFWNGRK